MKVGTGIAVGCGLVALAAVLIFAPPSVAEGVLTFLGCAIVFFLFAAST